MCTHKYIHTHIRMWASLTNRSKISVEREDIIKPASPPLYKISLAFLKETPMALKVGHTSMDMRAHFQRTTQSA